MFLKRQKQVEENKFEKFLTRQKQENEFKTNVSDIRSSLKINLKIFWRSDNKLFLMSE